MSDTTTESIPPNAERRRRVYLFSVTSLAVFLVAVVVGAPPRDEQPIHARIVSSVVDGCDRTEAWRREVQDAVLSRAQLARAILAANAGAKPSDVEEEVHHFIRELVVAAEPAAFGGPGQLTIGYQGSHPIGAAVINSLVQQYVEANSVQVESDAHVACDRARQEAKAAHDRAAKVARRRNAFRKKHARTLNDTTSLAADSHAPGAAANPAWIDLRDQISWMTAYHADLVRESSESHPAVLDLQSRLSGLREQLERTPQWLAANPSDEPPDVQSPRAAVATNRRATDHSATPLQIALAYDRLQQEYGRAQQAEQGSLVRAELAGQELARVVAERLQVDSWAARPSGDYLRGFGTTALAILLGVVCGGLVVFKQMGKDPILRTVADVKASLSVPVIGCVGGSTMALASPAPPFSLSARLVERLSQLTLVFFLFCVVLLAVAEDGFLLEFAIHPLASLSDGIRRIPSLLAG